MQTKLTLRLEEELIERAKAWARGHRLSLSRAVADVFARLLRPEPAPPLSAWIRRLSGIAAGGGSRPSHRRIRQDYRAHLAKKYS